MSIEGGKGYWEGNEYYVIVRVWPRPLGGFGPQNHPLSCYFPLLYFHFESIQCPDFLVLFLPTLVIMLLKFIKILMKFALSF